MPLMYAYLKLNNCVTAICTFNKTTVFHLRSKMKTILQYKSPWKGWH